MKHPALSLLLLVFFFTLLCQQENVSKLLNLCVVNMWLIWPLFSPQIASWFRSSATTWGDHAGSTERRANTSSLAKMMPILCAKPWLMLIPCKQPWCIWSSRQTSAEKSVATFAHFTPEVTCWNSEAFWKYCRRCTRYTCGYEFLDIKWYLHQLFDDADFDRLFQLNFMALGHWIWSHLGTKIREPPAQVEVLLLAMVDLISNFKSQKKLDAFCWEVLEHSSQVIFLLGLPVFCEAETTFLCVIQIVLHRHVGVRGGNWGRPCDFAWAEWEEGSTGGFGQTFTRSESWSRRFGRQMSVNFSDSKWRYVGLLNSPVESWDSIIQPSVYLVVAWAGHQQNHWCEGHWMWWWHFLANDPFNDGLFWKPNWRVDPSPKSVVSLQQFYFESKCRLNWCKMQRNFTS